VTRERGIRPETWAGKATILPIYDWMHTRELLERADARGVTPLLKRFGLAVERKGRDALMWWDATTLIVAHDKSGMPGFVVGRRHDPRPFSDGSPSPKYVNQIGKVGVIPARVPYGMPALNTPGLDGVVLEGSIDAMSLEQMCGIPTVAMHQRPGAKEVPGSHFGLWVQRHVVALRTWKRMRILPDADEDPASRATGMLYAENSAAFARSLGINAEATTMETLGAPSLAKDPNAWLLQCRRAGA
jgi:hypothetical protein